MKEINFYHIDAFNPDGVFKRNTVPSKLLRKACGQRGINFCEIDALNFRFFEERIKINKSDLVYRSNISPIARLVEKFFITQGAITFYHNYYRGLYSFEISSSFFLYQKYGVPVPKTVFNVSLDREDLKKSVKYLGGFPVIVKDTMSSHGRGVALADSFPALFSAIKKFKSSDRDLILREFIKSEVVSHARLIVLGNKVVDSIEYLAPPGEFRTNVGEKPIVKPKKFSSEVEKIAIKAVALKQIEFGGVDIIFDQKNNPYVMEVNFPCYFPRCQLVTGVNIAGMIVDYLIQKSKKK